MANVEKSIIQISSQQKVVDHPVIAQFKWKKDLVELENDTVCQPSPGATFNLDTMANSYKNRHIIDMMDKPEPVVQGSHVKKDNQSIPLPDHHCSVTMTLFLDNP